MLINQAISDFYYRFAVAANIPGVIVVSYPQRYDVTIPRVIVSFITKKIQKVKCFLNYLSYYKIWIVKY